MPRKGHAIKFLDHASREERFFQRPGEVLHVVKVLVDDEEENCRVKSSFRSISFFAFSKAEFPGAQRKDVKHHRLVEAAFFGKDKSLCD